MRCASLNKEIDMDYRKHHFDLKDSTYGISLFTPPEKNTQKPPLLLLPGEFRTYRSYLEIIKLFMESGRVVMSPYFPTRKHKNKYGKESSSIAFDLPLIFSIRRAFLLKAVITLQEIYCFEKVDVLAHSSGCIPAVFAGLECGDLFGNFVFDSLPAVTGKESRWQITMRAMAT